jgi:phosphotransferase system  glucose/maltose/N-acetylglucosamine-specific IIC component
MSPGGWMMVIAVIMALAALFLVVFALVRSIRNERTPGRSLWREFGLGLALMILFFGTWIAHGIAEWQVFTDEQSVHGESTGVGDFVSQFGQATLENWQSEFLQLFAFVALSALFIHKGSAESKDSDEKVEAALRRIEERLGRLPPDAPRARNQSWRLPDTPIDLQAQHEEQATT